MAGTRSIIVVPPDGRNERGGSTCSNGSVRLCSWPAPGEFLRGAPCRKLVVPPVADAGSPDGSALPVTAASKRGVHHVAGGSDARQHRSTRGPLERRALEDGDVRLARPRP